MKIKLGLRGNSDAVYGIIIKIDDLSLITADNLFLIGIENRKKVGAGIVALLDSLSCVDNQIEIRDNLIPLIESELYIEAGTLNKYTNE